MNGNWEVLTRRRIDSVLSKQLAVCHYDKTNLDNRLLISHWRYVYTE